MKHDKFCLNKEFLKCINYFEEAEKEYKSRNFKDALSLIDKSLEKITAPSAFIMSQFYDMTASILWKLGEKDKSYVLWKKSLEYDNSNRHSGLSINLLFSNETWKPEVCELFIKLKLNEYFYVKEAYDDFIYNEAEEEKIINYLLQFWKNNLSCKNLDKVDELELVDYFINLKVF